MLSNRFQDPGSNYEQGLKREEKLKRVQQGDESENTGASGTQTPVNGDETRLIGAESTTASPSASILLPSPSSSSYSPESFAPLLKKLVLHPSTFTTSDVRLSFQHVGSSDGCTPAQIGAFLSALRLTGKDGQPSVVAECAKVMQDHAIKVTIEESSDADEGPICDIVGTGGDGQNTFNVSTTAAIVAAGVGCRVFKHGNKAATSSSGSADILLSLGCPITSLTPSSIPPIASKSRFLFLYAPNYHPAMVRVAPIRKSLSFPTIFNALGPLINPAKPKAMIVGVHSAYLGPIFAEALRITGVERAWVVCGREGLDEVSIQGETDIWDLENGNITQRVIHPTTDFGLETSPLSLISGGSPSENATTLHALLEDKLGPRNPIENFVVLNTAALLIVSGKAKNGFEGVELARKSLKDGSAKEVLEKFRQVSSDAVVMEEERRKEGEADR